MDFRTDLALERCEFLGKKEINGVEIKEWGDISREVSVATDSVNMVVERNNE